MATTKTNDKTALIDKNANKTGMGMEDITVAQYEETKPSSRVSKVVFLVILLLIIVFAIYLIAAYFEEIWPFEVETEDETQQYPVTTEDIEMLREELRELFDESTDFPTNGNTGDIQPLIPTAVRLVFHDCGGPPTNIDPSYANKTGYNSNAISVCDGCIDSTNLANHAFLKEGAIDYLEDVYQDYNLSNKMSRADFWVTAGLLALEYASGGNPTGSLWPNRGFYFGRIDCEISPAADEGDMAFPNPDGTWNDTLAWFGYFFNLTIRESVALIGAHTLGRAHANATGYINRWVPGSNILDNLFYFDLIDQNKAWEQFIVPGTGRIQWGDFGENNQNMMLNSDMSLFIKIEDYLSTNNGSVACVFVDDGSGRDICPRQQETASIVEEFASNNALWLEEFSDVFEKMTFTGYNKDDLYMVKSCVDEAYCKV